MVSTTVLNCAMLRDPGQAHAYLARMLRLPDYYGNNLDALYDCLTEMSGCDLVLVGAAALRQGGGYGARVLETLEDAARETPGLRLICDEAGGAP